MKHSIFILLVCAFTFLGCSDHGTKSVVETDDGERGGIAFRLLKSETPADVWLIVTRLEREGYPALRESVYVHGTSDTIKIKMTGVAAGYWNVTVDAKDSLGNIRYTGSASVLILQGQTVQAVVQMHPTGGTGSAEIIVTWQSAQPHLQIRTAGEFFLPRQVVPVTVTNISHETVILSPCCTRPDLRIQRKLDDGTWTPPGECELRCPSIFLPLKPGATMFDSAIRIEKPGVYRLMLRYWPEGPWANPFAFTAYSNEFTVLAEKRDSVSLGQSFGLEIGQSVAVQGTGLKVTFRDVTEDSRCPIGVVCVWAGNGKILLDINQTEIALNTPLEPKQASYGPYMVRLLSLSPYPQAGHQIRKDEYVAVLIVTR